MTSFLFLAAALFAAAQAPAPSKPVKDPGPLAQPAPAAPAKKDLKDPGPTAAPAKPKAKSETLHFAINWPSGLSLGEGEMTSALTESGWRFTMKADFAIPAFAVAESAESRATADLCSTQLEKRATRGKRQTDESTTFDNANMLATRETRKGGKAELKTSSCPKDALAFLQFLRRELAAGRLPAAQPVYYGAPYQTRVQYKGTQTVRSGDAQVEADRLTTTVKGPASEYTFDLVFARDEARTPLLAELPLAMGKFTVEFSR